MAVGDAYVLPGFLTPVLTQLFFRRPPTTFLTCFCRGERRKYAGKKSRLKRGSNSQPPGHESYMLTTEPTRAPGPLDYWSNTLPLSHAGPFKLQKKSTDVKGIGPDQHAGTAQPDLSRYIFFDTLTLYQTISDINNS